MLEKPGDATLQPRMCSAQERFCFMTDMQTCIASTKAIKRYTFEASCSVWFERPVHGDGATLVIDRLVWRKLPDFAASVWAISVPSVVVGELKGACVKSQALNQKNHSAVS